MPLMYKVLTNAILRSVFMMSIIGTASLYSMDNGVVLTAPGLKCEVVEKGSILRIIVSNETGKTFSLPLEVSLWHVELSKKKSPETIYLTEVSWRNMLAGARRVDMTDLMPNSSRSYELPLMDFLNRPDTSSVRRPIRLFESGQRMEELLLKMRIITEPEGQPIEIIGEFEVSQVK